MSSSVDLLSVLSESCLFCLFSISLLLCGATLTILLVLVIIYDVFMCTLGKFCLLLSNLFELKVACKSRR